MFSYIFPSYWIAFRAYGYGLGRDVPDSTEFFFALALFVYTNFYCSECSIWKATSFSCSFVSPIFLLFLPKVFMCIHLNLPKFQEPWRFQDSQMLLKLLHLTLLLGHCSKGRKWYVALGVFILLEIFNINKLFAPIFHDWRPVVVPFFIWSSLCLCRYLLALSKGA